VEIIETRASDALEGLRTEWDELVERSERAGVYQTWEWNEAWWRHFKRGKRLRVLQVRQGGELVGIAPLYVSRHLGTPLRRLAFLGTGAADYMDVIAPDDRAAEVCSAVLRHLTASRGYDLADLQQMAPTAHLREEIEHRGKAGSRRHHAVIRQEPCPYMELAPTWDEVAAKLGKKMRSNLSYYDRHIAKSFESVESRLAEPQELEEAMSALFDLHQKRWNARLLPGVLGSAKTQQFHLEVARRFAERGWLRLHLVRLEGRTVAVLYCYSYRGRYYYYLGGFAPDLGKYSLGTVQTMHAIKQAISERCAEFDFLRGDEPYKYRWMPQERFNARLLLRRPKSLRSHAMARLNNLEQYVEHQAKAFAAKRGRSKPK
jgi:CelD/BcsL family acetyltransferase involved in cellulose biosynthesis